MQCSIVCNVYAEIISSLLRCKPIVNNTLQKCSKCGNDGYVASSSILAIVESLAELLLTNILSMLFVLRISRTKLPSVSLVRVIWLFMASTAASLFLSIFNIFSLVLHGFQLLFVRVIVEAATCISFLRMADRS